MEGALTQCLVRRGRAGQGGKEKPTKLSNKEKAALDKESKLIPKEMRANFNTA